MRPLRWITGPVWRWPLALGLLSAIGLVSALVADGAWDALSWVALGLPVAVCLWCSRWRRAVRPRPPAARAATDEPSTRSG